MHLACIFIGGAVACTLALSSFVSPLDPLLLHTIVHLWTCRSYKTRRSYITAQRGMQTVPLFCKIYVSTWTRLHVLILLLLSCEYLYLLAACHASKPNCGAHSWGVPRCHCPLEIPSICRSLLATLQLLRRFCFGLRASSSNVQQPASLKIHRQGKNTEYSAKEHPHMHTRCKAQPKSQRWCSTTQTARWYNVLSF